MFDVLHKTQNMNIGLGIFAAIIMLIVLVNMENKYTHINVRSFRKLSFSILIINLLDALSWSVEGKVFAGNIVFSYLVNIAGFVFQTIVVILWVKYAWQQIFKKPLVNKTVLGFLYIPIFILNCFIVTTPFNGWTFYIDSTNFFHRNNLVYIASACLLGWCLLVFILALYRMQFEKYYEQKRELVILNIFAAGPLVATLIQMSGYGISIIWSVMSLSALLIFCNMQQIALSKDDLTNLNNRRSFENYLTSYKLKEDDVITVIMLDINNFKSINDEFGHKVGDNALIQTAQILKEVFNDNSFFIARYGGDEFIIATTSKSYDVENAKKKVQFYCDALNHSCKNKYNLYISLGYHTATGKISGADFEKMIIEADKKMYQDKAAFYKGENDRRIALNGSI